MVSEVFRQEPRAVAMSFSLTFNWICNFILVLTFRFIQVRKISRLNSVIFKALDGRSLACNN